MAANYAADLARISRSRLDYFWLARESTTGYYVHVHAARAYRHHPSVMEAGYISDYTQNGGKVYLDLYGIADSLEFDSLQAAIDAIGIRYHPHITGDE